MTTPDEVRSTSPMFSLQRRERLMDELRSSGSIRVRELATTLDVSEPTIRRDINALARQGLVTRVHGGATLKSSLERDGAARGKAGSRFIIGMVVPSLDYYWPQVTNGARAAALTAHSQIALRGSSYSSLDDRAQITELLKSGVDGLIVAPSISDETGRALVHWLDTLSTPVVLVERTVPDDLLTQRLESVSTDHAYGAGLAIRHLYAEGHERIGILLPPESPTSKHIGRGWYQACTQLGLSTDEALKGDSVGFNSPDREAIMAETLERIRGTGTTALLVHSDPEAIALLQHCTDHGVSVPGDLAIVAYDDEVASLGHPPLSAVRPPKQHVGRVAVESLVARLHEGNKRPIHRVQLNPQLVIRQSSRLTS
jgi:DNA-binding LacI/PurR family transcriptional regulator